MEPQLIRVGRVVFNARYVTHTEWAGELLTVYLVPGVDSWGRPHTPRYHFRGEAADAVWAKLAALAGQSGSTEPPSPKPKPEANPRHTPSRGE